MKETGTLVYVYFNKLGDLIEDIGEITNRTDSLIQVNLLSLGQHQIDHRRATPLRISTNPEKGGYGLTKEQRWGLILDITKENACLRLLQTSEQINTPLSDIQMSLVKASK